MMKRSRWIAAAGISLLLLAACGTNDGPPTLPTETAIVESQAITTAQTEASTVPETRETEPVANPTSETETTAVQTGASTEAPTEALEPTEPAETKAPTPSVQPAGPAPATPTEPPKPTEPKPTEPKPTQPSPAQPMHTHSYKAKTISPTCTEKGYTEHSCSCGDSYRDSYTDALGHSFTEQTVAATCTNGGYTLRTCSRCKETETTNSTQALGHDYRETVVSPTTSSQGYTEHTCSRCGDSYRDNYTDKLKEVFDLQAVIDYGNAYAQSLGFTIDRSMTLANSSYYPGYYGGGYSLDFLKERVVGNVQYTADMLIADGDTIPGFHCNIHASYEPETDKYYIVVLYG